MKQSTLATALFLLTTFAATEALSEISKTLVITSSVSKDVRYAKHFNNRFDKNNDGKVSLVELDSPKHGVDIMRRMDADHDGFITSIEAKKAYNVKHNIKK